ncbi:MAG: protocatechuate 3,4-dioxygenase subunit alpha [Pseudomonadota bacterium]
MVQKLDWLTETPSQTAGPYVHLGLMPAHAGNPGAFDLEVGKIPISQGVEGEIVEVRGSVLDGVGWPLRDVMIESWQADAAGRYPGRAGADPAVGGFCRFAADPESGEFTLRTVKPGATPARGGGMQAPHISLWIVARGINLGLHTRMYFEDEDNSGDPLLARIEQRSRVETLIARRTEPGRYRFDIRLQGEGETVFLDI